MKKNGNRKGNVRGIFLVSIFVLCTAIVLWRWYADRKTTNPGQHATRDSLYVHKRQIAYGQAYMDVVKYARNGDIIVRKGTDMTSQLLLRFNLQNAAYSHAGIVNLENDSLVVYHALGGELTPNQAIQRETVWSYGNPAYNEALGLYRSNLDSGQIKSLLNNARESWRQKIPFDTAFDLATNEKLYCTEFVIKTIEKAVNDSIFHRSELKGRQYIAVDDITGNAAIKKVESWKY